MSDHIRIRQEFLTTHRENKTIVECQRTSPDVEGAKVTSTVVIEGFPYARRVTYAEDAIKGFVGMPSWGGSDY